MLTPIGTTASFTAGVLPSNPVPVGTFLDSNLGAVQGNFTAMITWGDGQMSPGTVTAVPSTPGLFSVAGTNRFATPNTYTISIAVQDNLGNTATIKSSALVTSPLAAAGTAFSTTPGVPLPSGTVVANFTDTNPAVVSNPNPASLLSAVITWGDGATSAGTVNLISSNGSTGTFTVTGTHLYAAPSTVTSYTVGVTIVNPSGQTATASSTATVTTPIAASGTTFAAAPGVPLPSSTVVANFTDTNPAVVSSPNPASLLSAVITWGDGATSTGTVNFISSTSSIATFTVTGAHTYAASDTSPEMLSVTIVDPSGQTAKVNSTAILTSFLNATGTSFTTVLGQTFTQTVANFTDTNPAVVSSPNPASLLSALINWGDGQTTPGLVSLVSSTSSIATFAVTGTHTYTTTNTTTPYSISVTITDPSGQTATATSTPNIAAPTLNATGTNFTAVPGVALPASTIVANFTDSYKPTLPITAVINWGDGQTTQGTVNLVSSTGSLGVYTVTGGHTYSAPGAMGSYAVTVTILDPSGQKATANSTVTTVASFISATGTTFTATLGQTFTQTVANFTDTNQVVVTNPNPASLLSAVINWGDGQTTPGLVSLVSSTGSSATFTVTGTHSYTTVSTTTPYSISVTITDPSGQSATTTSTPIIAAPTLNATGTNFTATPGQLFTTTVANFTDSYKPTLPITAAINWGDGQTTQGTVNLVSSTGSLGVYTVTGTHIYSASSPTGSYAVTVTILDPSGQKATANSTAEIAAPIIVATGTTFSTTAGQLFTTTVANFTDSSMPTSPITAVINWGDGQTSEGQVNLVSSMGSLGVYTVTGTHIYASASPATSYSLTTTIIDPSGQTFPVTSTAQVLVSAPISGLTGGLADVINNGPHAATGFTNTNRPIFTGTAAPYSTVLLYARHFNTDAELPLGEAVTNGNGQWILTSGPLAVGTYIVSATVTIPGGYPSNMIALNGGNLVYIDLTPRLVRWLSHGQKPAPHPQMPRAPKVRHHKA